MSRADSDRGIRPYLARPVEVLVDDGGLPLEVGGRAVTSIRELWLVEEGWWTGDPLRRLYFELVTVHGENLTIFRALPGETWFIQRA